MKPFFCLTIVLLLVATIACGGGGSNPGGNPSSKLVDPSGNWVWNLSDTLGNTERISAMMFQVGADVSALHMLPFMFANAVQSPNECYPITSTFVGLVSNVDQFSGHFTMTAHNGQVATLNFTGTLNPQGTTVNGTYTSTATTQCFPLAASGTLQGGEVPSVSGSWTGTIQPCLYDGATSTCSLTGNATAIRMTVVQHDDTANATGSYTVDNQPGFSSGTITSTASDDGLWGNAWQFHMADNNGTTYLAFAHPSFPNTSLSNNRSFTGVVRDLGGNQAFWLTCTH